MDNKFKFTLSGSKLFLAYGIPFLFIMGLYLYGVINMTLNEGDLTAIGDFYLYYGLFIVGLILLNFVVMNLSLNNIFHREGKLEFKGSFGRYLWINLRDGILSLASFGIYSFWFAENMSHFYVDNSTFAGRSLKFKGKGGELFKRFLIYFLPFTILFAVAYMMIVFSMINIETGDYNIGKVLGNVFFMFLSYFLYIIGYTIYMYKVLEWGIDYDCEEYSISLETDFWPTFRFLLKQVGLTMITFGLFTPAAITNAYKYMIKHVVITNGYRVISLKNELDTTSSWGYLFGQYLLTYITAGIYTPWAIVRTLRWFLESTDFEGFEEIEDEPEAMMIEQELEDSVIEVKTEIEDE